MTRSPFRLLTGRADRLCAAPDAWLTTWWNGDTDILCHPRTVLILGCGVQNAEHGEVLERLDVRSKCTFACVSVLPILVGSGPPMMLGSRAVDDVATLLREAALTEIMPRFRKLASGEVRAKTGPLDSGHRR